MLCEMQSNSSRIWTRVAVSICFNDNHYTSGLRIYHLIGWKNFKSLAQFQVGHLSYLFVLRLVFLLRKFAVFTHNVSNCFISLSTCTCYSVCYYQFSHWFNYFLRHCVLLLLKEIQFFPWVLTFLAISWSPLVQSP